MATPSVGEQRVSYWRMPAPQPGFVEQVYAHEMVPDADRRVTAALINERQEIGVAVDWSADEFPHAFEWLHLREGAYALGIEPSTHGVGGSSAARADGTLSWLKHAESRSYSTRFRVVHGREALRDLERSIREVAAQPEADIPDIVLRADRKD